MQRREVMTGLAAMLASAGLSNTGAGAGDRLPPRALLEPSLFTDWQNRFVSRGGRVIDDANAGISHSEGQGYGMLLAAFAGDRDGFDRLWGWTQDQLGLRADGLFAWRYEPTTTPRVRDLNNASDGDMLIAWGLAEAADRWDDPECREAGAKIACALMQEAVVESEGRSVLLPGVAGFSQEDRPDGPVINLSYWVFPAFPHLARLAPELDWKGLARSGLDILAELGGSDRQLPTDWTALSGKTPVPATGFPPLFGWNAIRVPLYLALADRGWGGQRAHLAPFSALWPNGGSSDPDVLDVIGSTPPRPFGSSGYRAIPAAVACALDGTPYPADLRHGEAEPYYPATLRLLTLAAARRRFPECF